MGRYLDLLRKLDAARPFPIAATQVAPPNVSPAARPAPATTKTTETTKPLVPPAPLAPEPVDSDAHRRAWFRRVQEIPLNRFAQEGCPVELSLPGSRQTIFFVPGQRDVDHLVQRGIGRGRIWTVAEFLKVWHGPVAHGEPAQTLAKIKAELNCELELLDPFSGPGDPSVPRGPR